MKKDFYSKLKENMKNAQNVLAFCNRYLAEILPVKSGVIVLSPRKLTDEAESELRGLLPESLQIQFEVAPKARTHMHLENIIQRAKPTEGKVTPDLEHRTLTIDLEGIPEGDEVWQEISEVLTSDGFFDSWKFIIEGKECNVLPKMAEQLAKNRERGSEITKNDIMDLKIGLANAQTIDDILKAIGG